jgi:hypothetical protein
MCNVYFVLNKHEVFTLIKYNLLYRKELVTNNYYFI